MSKLKTKYQGLIIAGTHSSVGKSSISVGLMRLLKRKGLTVQPFKVGPDYIDPGHHSRACGVPSYNLDTVMCSTQYAKTLFREISSGKDIALVEGVMGLFDGAHAKKETGSTAEIAKILGLSVILVIEGTAMARSAAALVKGFMRFDRKIGFLGIIANRVNSPGHAKILKDAIEHHSSAKFLGNLPEVPELTIPSRHLGLFQSDEQTDQFYDLWADHIEKHIDVLFILKSIRKDHTARGKKNQKAAPGRRTKIQSAPFTVGIAKDKAFQFFYQDTLDLFRDCGGTIKFFSPIHDRKLPNGLDWIYIPGGYPELHAEKLSANSGMISEIRSFADSGKVMVAECGGLMYLGQSIVDETGKTHGMTGLFNFSTSLKEKQLTLGYRKLYFGPSADLPKKILLKGHEFHFSTFLNNQEIPNMTQRPGRKGLEIMDGYIYKKCFALYSHVYWATSPGWFNFILSHTKN